MLTHRLLRGACLLPEASVQPIFVNSLYFKDKFLYIDCKPVGTTMLPASHCEPYRELQKVLELMLSKVSSNNWQGTQLKDIDQKVQQVFNKEVATLRADKLAPEDASRWQSIQTEIHKQMRLLSTDVMLLQAARSSATSLARSQSLCDRITTLIKYCQTLNQF